MGELLESGIDIPDKWLDSARKIAENKWRKVFVVGPLDSGKSTYCAFLSRWLVEKGHKAAVVDADIGQKDIGPPAAITLGYPDPKKHPSDVSPAALYFVGAVSPAGHFLPMVVGVKLLVDLATGSFVIVNTTGLIHGPGRALKSYKIEAVCPDVIVGMGKGLAVSSLLKSHRNHHLFRLPISARAAMKSQDERRLAREKSFHSYFRSAKEGALDLDRIVFQRSLIFTGKVADDPKFLHCERTPEGLLAVSYGFSDAHGQDLRTVPAGFEQNLLCGVADRRSRCLGLAIIRGIDFADRTISLLTPAAMERIRVIQFGDFYLSPQGHEIGRRKPGIF